jgi:alpha-ketoglutarate-dependent taurine dioxygenase
MVETRALSPHLGVEAFSRRLGAVVSQRGEEIFEVSLDPAVNPVAEYLEGTFHWHMDGTSDPTPQKATTLTARHAAMVAGQTEFASTYAATRTWPTASGSATTACAWWSGTAATADARW